MRRMSQAGGLPAISRWLSAAIPPESSSNGPLRPRQGSQQSASLAKAGKSHLLLPPLRGGVRMGNRFRWYRSHHSLNHRLMAGKPPAWHIRLILNAHKNKKFRTGSKPLLDSASQRSASAKGRSVTARPILESLRRNEAPTGCKSLDPELYTEVSGFAARSAGPSKTGGARLRPSRI